MDAKIEFYESAENMSIKRYQRFNKFLMIANEVGSDFTDFNTRLTKSVKFLSKGMIEDGVKELENFRQMVFNSFTEYNPRGLALALLVKSINGEEFKDITPEGLDRVLAKLEEVGYTQEQARDTVADVKKK